MLADVHRSRGRMEGSGSDEGNQPNDDDDVVVDVDDDDDVMGIMGTCPKRQTLQTILVLTVHTPYTFFFQFAKVLLQLFALLLFLLFKRGKFSGAQLVHLDQLVVSTACPSCQWWWKALTAWQLTPSKGKDEQSKARFLMLMLIVSFEE